MALSILENLHCKLPVGSLPAGTCPEPIFTSFEDGLSNLDGQLFAQDALWRDLFALSGSIRTFYGVDSVVLTWKTLTKTALIGRFTYLTGTSRIVRLGESNWIEGTFSFVVEENPARLCKAILSLTPTSEGTWKIWVIRTFLDQLRNHPSVDKFKPSRHVNIERDATLVIKNAEEPDVFECVVVGAGQAGLSVAGRLLSQGIRYVLIEKNVAVGDSWKNRYKSTKLHTTRESSHLPFDRTFPPHYPEYLSKDDLAQGYSDWAKKFEINVWLSTTLISGQWHPEQNIWTLSLLQGDQRRTIKATHIVMSLGAGCQIPSMPTYVGKEHFKGRIEHSADYTSAEGWQDKHGIVVGTANTAHDVAEDMVAAGMSSVTMIQRSPTYVLPAEYYTRVQNLTYNSETPTEIADHLGLTNPLALSRLISMHVLNRMAEAEPERFDALERSGFKVVRYGDIIYQVFDRFGGHYMDVGASAKIAKGLIRIKSDGLPTRYTENGLEFTNGTELKADLIVFATGFVGSMKVAIRDILGSEVADRIEDFWGINDEGEIRGAFKPSGHPNLWMHGGTCVHARYMSRYIALQIRAALDGMPLPVASSLVYGAPSEL